MARIVGCVEAYELSTVKQGANQHSHIIMRKSVTAPAPAPTPENDLMEAAVMKALLGLDEITKNYAVALSDEDFNKFMAKTADERIKEAKMSADAQAKADAAAKEKADLAEDAKKGVDGALAKLTAENVELRKKFDDQTVEREMEKTSNSAEFKGYPGGASAVLTILKSIAELTPEMQKPIIDSLKSQAQLALKVLGEEGGRTEEDMEKTAPANAEFKKKVAEYATEKSVSQTVAFKAVADANKELYNRAMAEESAPRR